MSDYQGLCTRTWRLRVEHVFVYFQVVVALFYQKRKKVVVATGYLEKKMICHRFS